MTHILTTWFAPLLIGGGASLLALIVLNLAELVGKVRRRVCRRQWLRLEQYRAEQELRSIRREAIHDMLETARTHRADPYGDLIEGTAVEVEQ